MGLKNPSNLNSRMLFVYSAKHHMLIQSVNDFVAYFGLEMEELVKI